MRRSQFELEGLGKLAFPFPLVLVQPGILSLLTNYMGHIHTKRKSNWAKDHYIFNLDSSSKIL